MRTVRLTTTSKASLIMAATLALTTAACSGGGEGARPSNLAATPLGLPASRSSHPSNEDMKDARIWPSGFIRDVASGEGQRIAVLDTGVARQYLASCTQCPVAVADGQQPVDEIGHGTSMVAALSGVARLGYPGVSPGAKVAVFSLATHRGETVNSDGLRRALDAAVASDVDVINMSLGSQTPDRRLRESINRAIKGGITITAAAGPDPTSIVLYPAGFPGVMSAVAAPTPTTKGSHDADADPHQEDASEHTGGSEHTGSAVHA